MSKLSLLQYLLANLYGIVIIVFGVLFTTFALRLNDERRQKHRYLKVALCMFVGLLFTVVGLILLVSLFFLYFLHTSIDPVD